MYIHIYIHMYTFFVYVATYFSFLEESDDDVNALLAGLGDSDDEGNAAGALGDKQNKRQTAENTRNY